MTANRASSAGRVHILVASVYGTYGGSTKVLMAAAAALDGAFDVTVRAPFEGAASRAPLELSGATLSSAAAKLGAVPRLLRLLATEWRFVSRLQPDAVYVHDAPSLLIYGPIARSRGIKVIYHVHGDEGRGVLRRLRDRLTDAKLYVARFLMDGNWTGPAALIANPVAVPEVAPRERTEARRLFLAASISDRKNQILAVETLAELRRRGRDATLHLCGPVIDAGYHTRLAAAIASAGMARHVVLEGVRSPAEIFDRADVILCPSKFEAQPLVFLEALAAGVPVVASRIEAHAELVADAGLDGIVELADLTPRSFADRIEALDPRAFAGVKAQIAEAYSATRFKRELREAMRRLLGELGLATA